LSARKAKCRIPYPASNIRHPTSGIRRRSSGFTLIELLVALTILVTAFAIIWSTFSATMKAWDRGTQLLDELRHGDFVMEQLVSALRSTAYFQHGGTSNKQYYGFSLKTSNRQYPADSISFITSSTAFVPPDSPLSHGLHRLEFSIENDEQGDAAVAIRAYPYLADMEESDVTPWYISSEVKGFRCRIYNSDDESWDNKWEDTNKVPSLVEVTLYMDPLDKEKDYEPVTIKRLVEIPIAPLSTNKVTAATDDNGTAATPGVNTGTGAKPGVNTGSGATPGVINQPTPSRGTPGTMLPTKGSGS